MPSFYRGLVIAAPLALALWLVIACALGGAL